MAVVKRGKVWQAQVRVGKDAAGKWITKSATADTKAAAERAERDLLAERDANRRRFVEPTSETLAEFLTGWLDREGKRLRPTTLERYRGSADRHIIPALGDVKLRDLSPRRVQAFLDGMGARPTTEQARLLMAVALKDAERLGAVSTNAAERARAPYQEKHARKGFSLEELDVILRAAEGRRIANLVKVAAYTGLRRGELLGLKWTDVDLKAQTLTVRRQVVNVADRPVVQDTPKTDAGFRTVPLLLPAVAALKAQQAAQKRERLVVPWVFTTETGGLFLPTYVSARFAKLVKRAEVEPRPLHSLRHTTASILLSAGVEASQAAKVMGHASLAVFYRVYADLLPQAGPDVRRLGNEFLARAQAAAKGAR